MGQRRPSLKLHHGVFVTAAGGVLEEVGRLAAQCPGEQSSIIGLQPCPCVQNLAFEPGARTAQNSFPDGPTRRPDGYRRGWVGGDAGAIAGGDSRKVRGRRGPSEGCWDSGFRVPGQRFARREADFKAVPQNGHARESNGGEYSLSACGPSRVDADCRCKSGLNDDLGSILPCIALFMQNDGS